MTPKSAELRQIADEMEKARARLANIATAIHERGRQYDQEFIDATQASYHAFTGAKIAGNLADRIEEAAQAAAAAELKQREQP